MCKCFVFLVALFISNLSNAQSWRSTRYYDKWEVTRDDSSPIILQGGSYTRDGKTVFDEIRLLFKDTLLSDPLFFSVGLAIPKNGDPYYFLQLSIPVNSESEILGSSGKVNLTIDCVYESDTFKTVKSTSITHVPGTVSFNGLTLKSITRRFKLASGDFDKIESTEVNKVIIGWGLSFQNKSLMQRGGVEYLTKMAKEIKRLTIRKL
jgi:hypothetical protein